MQNELGPEGGKALAEALKVNASLKSFDLSGHPFGIGGVGPEGGKALAEALKVNQTLQWIK